MLWDPSLVSFQYCEAILAATVAFLCLSPRPDPNDSSFFGGNLSNPFRKLLFAVTFFRCARIFGSMRGNFAVIALAIESTLLGFLRLLVPYLLQRRLSEVININPGKDLQAWLYFAVSMSLLAVFLIPLVSERFWIVKRLGNALLVFPIVKTCQLYLRTLGRNDQSKILTKTLISLEYITFTIDVTSMFLYDALNLRTTTLVVGINLVSAILSKVRLLFHGLLLNLADEAVFWNETQGSASGNEAEWHSTTEESNISGHPPSKHVSTLLSRSSTVLDDEESMLALVATN